MSHDLEAAAKSAAETLRAAATRLQSDGWQRLAERCDQDASAVERALDQIRRAEERDQDRGLRLRGGP